ncbi:hypothetical protein QS423_07770 [Staphylococcus pseudintermedius]|nr:hypothetical protein QS423_07770 [Staphylococcus pseudintermedius]
MTLKVTEALTAILYTVGEDGIDEAQLLASLDVDYETLNRAIDTLELPGLMVQKFGQTYVLTTQKEAEPYIESLIINKASTKLSQAGLSFKPSENGYNVNEVNLYDSDSYSWRTSKQLKKY